VKLKPNKAQNVIKKPELLSGFFYACLDHCDLVAARDILGDVFMAAMVWMGKCQGNMQK